MSGDLKYFFNKMINSNFDSKSVTQFKTIFDNYLIYLKHQKNT